MKYLAVHITLTDREGVKCSKVLESRGTLICWRVIIMLMVCDILVITALALELVVWPEDSLF